MATRASPSRGLHRRDRHYRWTRERVGTVHTVQGREADSVILVLGAPMPTQRGARGWAGGPPNILNVAATRAQENLYVVGSRSAWADAGVFGRLARNWPPASEIREPAE
ncbi:AAA domain-containing protein [Methylobacterium sp. WL2]|uniref:AAA domain-containing protein n=1 Tax=Methylobacterium sp. WL2 TaxID=2603902 RepID=UPI002484B5F6|nr:AAA domain-containing protein [Methylobacterium sp. WL2]